MRRQPTSLLKGGKVSGNLVRWALFQDGPLRCAWCSCPLTPATVTRDHLAPRQKGARWTREALVPSCSLCNTQRGRTRLADWITHLGRIPVSTVWLLHAFAVTHPNHARAQGITQQYLSTVDVIRDTDPVMTRERKRYRKLEIQIIEEHNIRIKARKEASMVA